MKVIFILKFILKIHIYYWHYPLIKNLFLKQTLFTLFYLHMQIIKLPNDNWKSQWLLELTSWNPSDRCLKRWILTHFGLSLPSKEYLKTKMRINFGLYNFALLTLWSIYHIIHKMEFSFVISRKNSDIYITLVIPANPHSSWIRNTPCHILILFVVFSFSKKKSYIYKLLCDNCSSFFCLKRNYFYNL